MKKLVKCPTCGQPAVFDKENSFRPFCSQRCQILDLGAWAEEKFAIPAEQSEISSVNKKQNLDDLDHDPTSHAPPKHHRN